MPRVKVHIVSEVDVSSMTGVCAKCGPVPLKPKRQPNGTIRYACRISERRWQGHDGPRGPRSWKDSKRGKLGVSPERMKAILLAQGNRCAICETSFGDATGLHGPHLDHDHATGRVREALCLDCNLALGRFGDSVARLQRAADYLRKHAA